LGDGEIMSQDITQTNTDFTAECAAAMDACGTCDTTAMPMPDMPVSGMPMAGTGDG
jgi:hypothetical protein